MVTVSVGVRLDPAAVSAWCARHLGSAPDAMRFELGYLSQVLGLRLGNGRDVVVKVRPWHDRLVGCGQVQQALFEQGFPVPEPMVAPTRDGNLAVSAEALVGGGELLPDHADSARLFAEALVRLVRAAPEAVAVHPLTPSPAWVAWDRADAALWPPPDDRDGDLNVHPGDGWLDEVGTAARAQLLALDRPLVVGHGDWYSQNLRWIDRRLRVVHDWDSVIAQPEVAIAGQAAAVWPGTGLPGEVATVRQTDEFLTAYQAMTDQQWSDDEVKAAWAAGLWTRAFDAKKASLVGTDPGVALTRGEAAERSRLAGW
jgi:hypothetical protein